MWQALPPLTSVLEEPITPAVLYEQHHPDGKCERVRGCFVFRVLSTPVVCPAGVCAR